MASLCHIAKDIETHPFLLHIAALDAASRYILHAAMIHDIGDSQYWFVQRLTRLDFTLTLRCVFTERSKSSGCAARRCGNCSFAQAQRVALAHSLRLSGEGIPADHNYKRVLRRSTDAIASTRPPAHFD